MVANDVAEIFRKLAEPFRPEDIQWKPGCVSKDKKRAMAIAFVDARCVMERLDSVLSPACWQDEYTPLPDGSVLCKVSIKIGSDWLVKSDVGVPNPQSDPREAIKGALSDSLKRACVHWGIGRYLYAQENAWLDYDADRKCFKTQPQLPAPAAPASAPAAPLKALPAPKPEAAKGNPKPKNGAELLSRLESFDRKLAAERLCKSGSLVWAVSSALAKAGHGTDASKFTSRSIDLAIDVAKDFETSVRQPRSDTNGNGSH